MPQPDFSPATDRNKQPILDVLCHVLPEHGSALEIASGTGQNVTWFAAGLPHWTWQPTDAQPCAQLAKAADRKNQRAVPQLHRAALPDSSVVVRRPGQADVPVDVNAIAEFCRRGPKDCDYATDQMLLALSGSENS